MGRLIPRRIAWQLATVREVVTETPRACTLVLDVREWPGHRAGQHVDVRLTAEDGYQAQRSYSIASAPELDALELTVELVDDGEVSPYFVEEVRAGDMFEVRGPIGGHFSWTVGDGGPLLLVGGGSGVVPLMSMLRHRGARASDVETHVLVSARGAEDALYRDELEGLEPRAGLSVAWTFTRTPPAGLERVLAPGRRRDARRGRARARRGAPDLRLRPDAVRRGRGRSAGRRGSRPARHPCRTLRPDRRMR